MGLSFKTWKAQAGEGELAVEFQERPNSVSLGFHDTPADNQMEYSFNTSNFDGINYIGFQQGLQPIINVGPSKSASLVLNNERGELVKALHIKPPQKAASADKALIAMRNHSDAERRRRERINAHLATLRTLIPGTNKVFLFFNLLIACFINTDRKSVV